MPDIAALVADKAKRYRFDFRGRTDLNLMITTHTQSADPNIPDYLENLKTDGLVTHHFNSNLNFLLSPHTKYDIYVAVDVNVQNLKPIGFIETRQLDTTNTGVSMEGAEKIYTLSAQNGAVDVFTIDNYQLGTPAVVQETSIITLVALTLGLEDISSFVRTQFSSVSENFRDVFVNSPGPGIAGIRVHYTFIKGSVDYYSGKTLRLSIDGGGRYLNIPVR